MNFWQTEYGQAFAGRKILVTGATGFIGSHLCDALVALGAEVHAMSRGSSRQTLVLNGHFWSVDLADFEAVQTTTLKIQPEFVYHLAALVTARQDLDLVLPMLHSNLVGTVNLLLAVAKNDCCERMVVVGSSEELKSGAPTSPYAAAKAGATTYAKMFYHVYGLPVVVARPFVTYGPRQEVTKLIPYTILALSKGERPRLSSGRRVGDFVYVLDVVRGLLNAGLRPNLEGELIELGTGEGTRVRDVVELLVELSANKCQPLFGALPDRTGERPQVADLNVTQRLLDWKPKWTLRNGLAETVAWYRDKMEK